MLIVGLRWIRMALSTILRGVLIRKNLVWCMDVRISIFFVFIREGRFKL